MIIFLLKNNLKPASFFDRQTSKKRMRPSRHLIPMGVGVLIALHPAVVSAAEPGSDKSQNGAAPTPEAATASQSNATASQSKQNSSSPPPVSQPEQQPSPATAPAPNLAPAPTTPSLLNPAPGTPLPEDTPYKPEGAAKPGVAPTYLNPDPNPLVFPTRPEDVTLRGIQPITLQQAIELAKRNNRTYQTTALQLNRSRSALQEQQAALYPTLDLQFGVTRSLSPNSTDVSSISSLFGQTNRSRISRGLSGSVTLGYDIYTSGRRTAQIRSAEQQVRSDELALEAALEQLRLDVAGDYYDLQQADESVRINQAAVRNARISLRDTQALERAGLGTRFDVLQAEVQLADALQQLTNARAQQQTRRRQLAQRLSLANNIDLAAADPVVAAGNWNLSLEQSIVLAFKNRAELEQQLAQRNQFEQQRRAALSTLGPTLSVSAQYQGQDSFRDEVGLGNGYTVSAGVRWSLFDGGAARARAAQAEANMAIAETRFADTRNQIRFQVESAYYGLRSNFENISTTTIAVAQAREALRLARLRFQAGVGTQTDVINSETNLTRAEGNLVNAILGYNRALASLQRAVTNLPVPTGAAIAPGTGASTPGSISPAIDSFTVPVTPTTPVPDTSR